MLALASRHKFKNGNKRTALITAVLFLRFCGLFLWNTNNVVEVYTPIWEDLMVYITISMSKKEISEDDLISKIKEKIDSHLTISYNNMDNPKNHEIDYKLMTEKISEWKQEIENDPSLMECLRRLADK